ncbi:MAG: GTPase [Eubacterium sp.]|nr:GTPase [Eubacterium sp.]
MNEDNIRVPVFLITGFLEAGKTSFLNMTIRQDYFMIEETTLLINCEQGEKEYNTSVYKELFNTEYAEITEKEKFTKENLEELDALYAPARVLLEYNPLWGVKELEEMKLPEGWGIVQEIVIVDASTFQVYVNNMKSLFVDMSRNAELVIFNRCTKDMPLANFRRSIKVVNPACQVLFEDVNGDMTDIFEDTVPYDLDADLITIEDVDYGIFYVDVREHPDRYRGKTVRFKGRVMKQLSFGKGIFVPGRQAMTCCADDTTFIGYVCESRSTPKLKTGNWVEVTAEVDYGYSKIYGEEGPILKAKAVKNAMPPEVDMVYFS